MLPKKALVFVVSLALLAALFSGCWGSRGNSSTTGSSSGSRNNGTSSSVSGGVSGSANNGANGGASGSGSLTNGASGSMNGGASGSVNSGVNGGASTGMNGGASGSGSLTNGADSGMNSGSVGSMAGSGSLGSGSASSGSGASSGAGASSGVSANGAGASFSDSAPAAATAAAPADGDGWMTRLVNAQNPLPEDFTVETARISGYDERLFDKRAAPELEALLADAEAAGCKLYLVSSYRSVERQSALFLRKTNSFLAEGFDQAEAERQAAMWVARPGTSEHNTGLAADLVSADWYAHHSDLTADFEETPEFAWLYEHCAEYGFILRYPRGKENITGVTYEPWHYRYVGKQAAAEIMQTGGTLEEYKEKGSSPQAAAPGAGAAGANSAGGAGTGRAPLTEPGFFTAQTQAR